MRNRFLTVLSGVLLAVSVHAQPNVFPVTTMNCYFFFGGSVSGRNFDQPKTAQGYWQKAVNLVSLLPTNAPLLVALQEVGWQREVGNLARCAATRYRRPYQALFVKGRDTYTDENVGALFDPSRGWGVAKAPARDADLDHVVSKHLVLHLTNAVTSMDVCIVHLLRAISGGVEKQQKQNEALKLWAEKQLAANPRANVIVLGDFNEGKKPGEAGQSLECLVRDGKPLVDSLTLAAGKIKTHADGHAYDRILISEPMTKGTSWLKFNSVSANEHKHGKGDERKLFTDHFPVTAVFTLMKPGGTSSTSP